MLKLPVEEIKRSISDTAVSMATIAFNARLQGAEGVTSATNKRPPEPTERERTYPQNRNSNNVWNPLPRTRKSFRILQPSVGKRNVAIFLSSSLERGRRPSCQTEAGTNISEIALLGD